jgi:hypothetical protein
MHHGFTRELARWGPQAYHPPVRLAEARSYCSRQVPDLALWGKGLVHPG